MDASLMDRVMRAEEAVAKDASEWSAHDRLVRLLREANLRERLREAREAMSARFPLDETRWREWIADEVRLTKGKRARRGEIVGGLFDRATREILSVPLWLGYLEFSLDQDWDPERRRELYERAAELCGGVDKRLLNNLGVAYAQMGRTDDAVRTLRHSLAVAPERNDVAHEELAKLMQLGEPCAV